jgi:hypothetical protein
MQYAMRIYRTVTLAYAAITVFPHYLINGAIFGKLVNTNRAFLCYLQFLSDTFFILRRNERDVIINVHRVSYKVIFILVSY